MSQERRCIINVGIGSWYPKGMERLKKSLESVHFQYDLLQCNKFPNNEFPPENLYNVKCSSFYEAMKLSYTKILWLDCSFWAIKNPEPVFEIIDKEGFYVESNGFNCAQECSDRCLQYFDLPRDVAENMKMISSGFLGVNTENKKSKKFLEDWFQSCKDGMFNGSREHGNQSTDLRFLHHRQDQSCASIIINRLGINIRNIGTHFEYYPNMYGTKRTENTIFLCQGM